MNNVRIRQLLHICFGLAIISLLYFNLLNASILFFVLIFGVLLSILSLRFKIPVVYWFLKKFERKEELKKFPGKGTIFFVFGSLLVLMFFGKDIAMASIIVLSLVDPISNSLRGGIKKNKSFLDWKKNILGFLASFLGILLLIFVLNIDISVLEAFFASLSGVIAESIDIRLGLSNVDDNLIIPLVSGIFIYLVKIF